MKYGLFFFLFFLSITCTGFAQIYVGFDKPDSSASVKDSIKPSLQRPDPDQGDIPFIDYKPAVIRMTPADSVSDYAYIRRNFTDQMVSVWNYPNRLYPASRIYGLEMDGKHYRSVKVSHENYVFTERIVEGEMDLYLYRKIPQMEGWIEFVGHDSLQSGYRNYMIVENENTRGKRENFGYYITLADDTLRLVTAAKMQAFADTYLKDTPDAKAKAMTFAVRKMDKTRKVAVIGLMAVGIIGLALTGESAASWIFMAGFPAAALVAYVNKPHTLHWQDMAEIVETYNRERALSGGK